MNQGRSNKSTEKKFEIAMQLCGVSGHRNTKQIIQYQNQKMPYKEGDLM